MNSALIIDYGIGNIGSLQNALKFLGYETEISSNLSKIKSAKRLIFPGVGAFDQAILKICKLDGLRDLIYEKTLIEKVPFLGVCLGMQLIMESSEEGEEKGLGLIKGKVKKFDSKNELKVPHMGWNTVNIVRENSIIEKNSFNKFYFVHSYYVQLENENKNAIGKTNYGRYFDSIVFNENIYGVQFHPEKSHKYGLKLLKKFMSL